MRVLINEQDKYAMNWVEGNVEWGTVKVPKGLTVEKQSRQEEECVVEKYTFTNTTTHDVLTSLKDIAIYTPFNDDYTSSKVCIEQRCHTHIWCGGQVSYVMALRMGGEPPHLGLVLTQGSLGGYSVERDLARISNDRGDFLLHTSPTALASGESFVIEWKLFWHDGKEDFKAKLRVYHSKYIEVRSSQYTWFENECVAFQIIPHFATDKEHITIKKEGIILPFEWAEGVIQIKDHVTKLGEQRYDIEIQGIKTSCKMLVLPKIHQLVKQRCEFIVNNQQYHQSNSHLDGAFLIYDNEEQHCYYRAENDFNAGRERVGMGVLLACYLQQNPDPTLEKGLKKYIEFVERELVDVTSGKVYNDYQRNDSFKRLYNYPWVSVLYLELASLWHDVAYIQKAYKVLHSFYQQDGAKFYAIEIPLARMLVALENAGLDFEYQEMKNCFKAHCETILHNGVIYPPHEVNFEQSIVAPAADLLLQMYSITKEEKYLEGGKKQFRVLELFNGEQPDYHMHEVAIRHWDGYWFGKRRMYGDTYPHYWSALTGNVYKRYAELTGDVSYNIKAEKSFRGVLSLFRADGTASCACVYPVSVNGEDATYYDAYANDQDWGMYFMLRNHLSNLTRKE